jgi:hypothetical protein
MCINLLNAGYNISVYSRNHVPTKELQKKGCKISALVIDFAENCNTATGIIKFYEGISNIEVKE